MMTTKDNAPEDTTYTAFITLSNETSQVLFHSILFYQVRQTTLSVAPRGALYITGAEADFEYNPCYFRTEANVWTAIQREPEKMYVAVTSNGGLSYHNLQDLLVSWDKSFKVMGVSVGSTRLMNQPTSDEDLGNLWQLTHNTDKG